MTTFVEMIFLDIYSQKIWYSHRARVDNIYSLWHNARVGDDQTGLILNYLYQQNKYNNHLIEGFRATEFESLDWM